MKQQTKGTARQCLTHFFEAFGKDETLIKFAKVSAPTEGFWRLHNKMPAGQTLLRVEFFLDLIGYKVEELEKLPTELFVLGQCIACDVVSMETISLELSIKPCHFYDYYRGVMPSTERMQIIKTIITQKESELKTKLSEIESNFQLSHAIDSHPDTEKAIGTDFTEFATACATIRRLGKSLLDGPKETRIAMRKELGQGSNPPLHCTWEMLGKLLSERLINENK